MQVGLVLEHVADGGLVQGAVRLGAGGAHGRALAGVEHPELDARVIRGQTHGAAQRVDLLDQVALADTADGGVAGHLAEGLDVVRQQQGITPHARRGEGRLGARMAAADHDDVEVLGVFHAGPQGLPVSLNEPRSITRSVNPVQTTPDNF